MLLKTVKNGSDIFKISYDQNDGSLIVLKNGGMVDDIASYVLSNFQIRLRKSHYSNPFKYSLHRVSVYDRVCGEPIVSIYKTIFDNYGIDMDISIPKKLNGFASRIIFKLINKDDLPKFLFYFGHLIEK